ncbi:YaiO family outer membrane beta-barrel protein [Polynucleobacter sp. MWH-Braz-FAM2G]|uniref:YaiO family outer membrane beta-barrel protein n=1 Tax=Polynucleobacter sp. MWH-Braz-FAM2G TaxID=1855883 RepID=UPI001BFCF454|nr:YaiO family outer membrane beta-barrel protein [Polynucleobacter sp. MWH-Braz-FAM2G]QWD90228.1 YaiO family outer membrane beta-barrel protein [Polynucleobacter sp. MWH-Braz-FAM2G]
MNAKFYLVLGILASIISHSVHGQVENSLLEQFDRPAIFDANSYVELGASYEGLTNNYAAWQSQYFDLMLPLKENGLVYLQLLNAQRFSQVDQSAYLNYAYPFKYGVVNVEGSLTHNPQFLAQNFYGAGWNGKLPYQFNYLLSGRESSYLDGRTSNQNIGLDKYFDQFRLAYVATYSTLNSQKSGWLSKYQVQWFAKNNNRIGFTYASGHEPTVVNIGNLTSIDTQQYLLDGLFWITNEIGLTASAWHAKQGSYYQRNGGQLGLRLVF